MQKIENIKVDLQRKVNKNGEKILEVKKDVDKSEIQRK